MSAPAGPSEAGEASEASEAGEARGPEAARPAPVANSKEKTPMCLVNELARYNKVCGVSEVGQASEAGEARGTARPRG